MPLSCALPPVALRPASAGDILLLRDLAERTWRGSYGEMLSPEQIDYMLGWMYAPEQIARELSEGVVWEIAEIDGQPVGFLSITFGEEGRAKLNKAYVLPERQGSGIGRALLDRAQTLAVERGQTEIALQVNKTNERAIRAYRRAGYDVEREAVFDIGGGFVMDDFIMTRGVPPGETSNTEHSTPNIQ